MVKKNSKDADPIEVAKPTQVKVKVKAKKKKKPVKVKAVDVVSDVARLARLMRSAEHEIGLNPAQWEALRFLSRCNEHSNSPIALTRYLGATKGTISQTVIALVKKGLVEKNIRPGERRSVVLSVTDAGHEMLKEDPWKRIEKAFRKLGPKKQVRAGAAMSKLLESELEVRAEQGMSSWQSSEFFGKSK